MKAIFCQLFSHDLWSLCFAGLDPEEVLEGIIQDHGLGLAPIDDPGAGLTVETIGGVIATVTLPCLLADVMSGIGYDEKYSVFEAIDCLKPLNLIVLSLFEVRNDFDNGALAES